MLLCWPFSLLCLVRWADSSNSSARFAMPLILSGHHVHWPSSKMEEKYVSEKRFIPRNVIYTRFQLCFEHVFLVAPRFKPGVPFTLGDAAITNEKKCCNYVRPYPCMDRQNTDVGSCATETLINAVDLVLGQDGVLWVLDIGISETFSDRPSKDGEAKIIGFDATTGKTKHLISLRSLTCRSQSRLQYLMVEYVKKSMTMLYVGDGGTRSIIAWNVQSNEGRRIKLPHTITLGCVENPHDDVFYIAMVEQQTGNYVYFTYLSSEDMYRTKTNYLQKRMNPKCIVNIGKKPYKMMFVGVGYGSVLYFRINGQNDLYSWDTKQSCLEENFMVVQRSKDCRTVTHVDVDADGALWVMQSNIRDFATGRLGCLGPSMLLTPVLDAPTAISDGLGTERRRRRRDDDVWRGRF